MAFEPAAGVTEGARHRLDVVGGREDDDRGGALGDAGAQLVEERTAGSGLVAAGVPDVEVAPGEGPRTTSRPWR